MARIQREHKAGTTIRVNATVRKNGEPETPTSITATIKDPNGTAKVSAQAMTAESTGRYYYDWVSNASDATGLYDVIISAVVDGLPVIKEKQKEFELT